METKNKTPIKVEYKENYSGDEIISITITMMGEEREITIIPKSDTIGIWGVEKGDFPNVLLNNRLTIYGRSHLERLIDCEEAIRRIGYLVK